jgi:hypothetical protein
MEVDCKFTPRKDIERGIRTTACNHLIKPDKSIRLLDRSLRPITQPLRCYHMWWSGGFPRSYHVKSNPSRARGRHRPSLPRFLGSALLRPALTCRAPECGNLLYYPPAAALSPCRSNELGKSGRTTRTTSQPFHFNVSTLSPIGSDPLSIDHFRGAGAVAGSHRRKVAVTTLLRRTFYRLREAFLLRLTGRVDRGILSGRAYLVGM